MRQIKTAREVVKVLGGNAAVCKLTGANTKNVYHWVGGAKMFPARHYDVMQRELRKLSVTAPPRLWNQTPPQKD